jgi:serine/threonine protein kinase
MTKLIDSLLCEIAIRRNLINIAQAKICLIAKEKLDGLRIDKSFGQVMVEKGFLTQTQSQWLCKHIPKIFFRCPSCKSVYKASDLGEKEEFHCNSCQASLKTFRHVEILDKKDLARREEEGKREDALCGENLGHCQLLSILGKGGMGVVYKAYHLKLGKPVAVKVLSRDITKDRLVTLGRFIREAGVLKKLRHPNIVRLFEVGDDKGFQFIVMEFLEGITLEEAVKKGSKSNIQWGLSVLEQCLKGLEAAHNLGIIHRDIKPGNIYIDKSGIVKITDFGLAKGIHVESNITQTGEILGTPSYMSPEQGDGQSLDNRTDLYSLGTTFYHYFTGKAPFEGDSALSIILKQIHEEPEDPKQANPNLPDGLCNVLRKMMAKEVQDRYQSTQEVLKDIEKIKSGKGLESLTPIRFRCLCGSKLQFMESDAATLKKCSKCGRAVLVPRPSKEEVFCFFPTLAEIGLARTLKKKKLATTSQIIKAFKKQEAAMRSHSPKALDALLAEAKVTERKELKRLLDGQIKTIQQENDILFRKIVLKSGLATVEQVEESLKLQKEIRGAPSPRLGDIMVSLGFLAPEQRDTVRKAMNEYYRLREDLLQVKLAIASKILPADAGRKIWELQKGGGYPAGKKRILQFLQEKKMLKREQAAKVAELTVRYLLENNPLDLPVPEISRDN